MKSLFVLSLLAICLTGCLYDPMGATTRAQIRARADVEVAQANRDAAIGVAQADASKSHAWAMSAPFLTAIVMGGLVILAIVYWQGRIHLERTKQGAPPIAALPALPRKQLPTLAQLRLLAEQQGMSVEVQGNTAYLLNEYNQIVGQRQLLGGQ